MQKSNQLVLSKLRQAQYYLQQTINVFQDNSSSLEVIKQSKLVQDLLRKADNLIAKEHLENCVADLIKKGEVENVTKEIRRLNRYKF